MNNIIKIILKILDYCFLISAVLTSICFGIMILLWFPAAFLTQSFILNILVINLLIILFFTPAVLIIVTFFVAEKYHGKKSKLLKVLSYFIICGLVFFHPIITICYSTYEAYMDKIKPYNPIRPILDYNKFVESRDKYTIHFPDKISEHATNVELYQNYYVHGDVEEYLKFNVSNDYINEEIKKHKYKKIVSGDKYKGHKPKNRYDDKNDMYYIIDDTSKGHWDYSYGIVVNKKNNEIIYYYSYY